MKYGETKPTIDLISIGLVCEDGREYYAISKDFNLKETWNRYDEKVNENYKPSYMGFLDGHYNPEFIKTYWLRDNVLKPIWEELIEKERHYYLEMFKRINVWTKYIDDDYYKFTYKEFKRLINKYGKTNKQIAEDVYKFVYPEFNSKETYLGTINKFNNKFVKDYWVKDIYNNPEFYGYYADYDWVVFCWLFGKMIDLPSGFPYYCKDLIQIEHEIDSKLSTVMVDTAKIPENVTIEEYVKMFNPMYLKVKDRKEYPKQTNEHNALADAIFCKDLYNFLNSI